MENLSLNCAPIISRMTQQLISGKVDDISLLVMALKSGQSELTPQVQPTNEQWRLELGFAE